MTTDPAAGAMPGRSDVTDSAPRTEAGRNLLALIDSGTEWPALFAVRDGILAIEAAAAPVPAAQPSADVVGAVAVEAAAHLRAMNSGMTAGSLYGIREWLRELPERLAAAREAGPPAAVEAGEGLRLLQAMIDWWDGEEGDGPSVLAATRAYLAAHPEPTNAPTRRTSDAG